MKLFRILFSSETVELIPVKQLRQQARGVQLGCDIKLVFKKETYNRDIRCAIECKAHETKLNFGEILVKLKEAKNHQVQIDHWIVIAPRAKITGNVHDSDIDRMNLEQEYPFYIQFWTKDSLIHEFFGLDTDIYDRWIDHPSDELHPSNWSKEKHENVRKTWLKRLEPQLRIPSAWAKYVTDKDDIGLFLLTDDRHCLRELWRDNRYIPCRGLDASHSPLPLTLKDSIKQWLNDKEPRTYLILADFGDGKTSL